jgi:hypothetical protein
MDYSPLTDDVLENHSADVSSVICLSNDLSDNDRNNSNKWRAKYQENNFPNHRRMRRGNVQDPIKSLSGLEPGSPKGP